MPVPRDSIGNVMPRPVPANCIDTTPPELWEVLWQIDPKGMMAMPARTRNRGREIQFWKGMGVEDIACDELPREFWTVYWRKFPAGHPQDPSPRQYVSPSEWDPTKDGYYIVNGRLQFRHQGRIYPDATGIDSFLVEEFRSQIARQ